ncbi:helix-turn-helix transcriptional regulator [Dysosmobacter sp.]|uniref:helix-turn-helix transcriptional regulator n=1 Tax=Dysosmobacter sp. TaxID=2591382 RepID=UPI002A894EAB|nr:helix-turn-helix transcriptional regulator [Dysosmobacter sp.]MDY3281289.1 helix-turn-helix transcriptional regulator [Dysosmobacter sp.]
MELSEKLTVLRRRAGLSQEQLADRLGVTRQSVSKWEGGAAMPELGKLVALADLFGVTLDDLVREERALPEPGAAESLSPELADRLEQKLDALTGDCRRSWGPYFQYTSKTRILGLPLVSVRFGRDRHPSENTLAVGVIAVGNFSVGVVSVGLISAGVFSLGMIAFGLLALGTVSIGYAALGVSAVGVCAAGVAAAKII